MEHRLLLHSEGECPWRSAEGEDFPAPRDSEIVLFASFLEHRLSMPMSGFVEGLLYYYMIQLHHLTPASILHISVFAHFCEAFLGIELHFDFFKALYRLVPLPFSERMGRVGCGHLELNKKVIGKYLVFPKIALSPQWPNDWFYIRSPSTGLSQFSAEPAEWLKSWYLGSVTGRPAQVFELLERAIRFWKMGVTTA